MKHLFTLSLFCLLLFEPAHTQTGHRDTLRAVFSATTFEIGRNHAQDTYLTEIFYRGPSFGISNERLSLPRFGKDKIVSQQLMSMHFSTVHNSQDNGKMFSGFMNYSYGLLYRWKPAPGWQLMAGGLAGVSGGFLYNVRNSNNPVNAKLRIDLAATGIAAYTFRVRNLPLTVRYQITLPAVGVFFSPQFGQSYYEIFSLGNYDGTIHFGSFHNQFYLQNLFTVDIPLGRNNLRLGYRNRIESFHVSDLSTKMYYNEFMIGISRTLILMPKNKRQVHQPVETPF